MNQVDIQNRHTHIPPTIQEQKVKKQQKKKRNQMNKLLNNE